MATTSRPAFTYTPLLLAITCAALAGCSFDRPGTDADFGAPPQHYEAAIHAYFEGILKDPQSAQYRIEPPVKAYSNRGRAFGGGVSWMGYQAGAEVNARGSFGNYTGFKPYLFLFSGENIARVIEGRGDYVLVHAVDCTNPPASPLTQAP